MQVIKGYKYTMEGSQNIKNFAKGVLALVNLKSNDMGIKRIETIPDTNLIIVISSVDNDSYLESYVGEIISKENIDIYIFDEGHLELDKETHEAIDKKLTETDFEYEYYYHFDNSWR